MMPRLASRIVVSALIRQAEAAGGNAAVLLRGDETAGAILLVIAARGVPERFLSRRLDERGNYVWSDMTVPPAEGDSPGPDVAGFVARARKRDPDIWAIELDIADAQRFADDLIAGG